MPNFVVCVMGLPASGKTTLCENLRESDSLRVRLSRMIVQAHNDFLIEVVHFDDIESEMRAMCEPCEGEFNANVWKNARLRARTLVEEFRSNPDEEACRLILLDDNFYYKSMRKAFRPDGVIFLDTHKSVCHARNESRSAGRVPDHVIDTMSNLLEIPDPRSVPTLTIGRDVTSSPLNVVVAAEDFWGAVLCNRDVTRISNPIINALSSYESLVNQCERDLRKCVSAYVINRRNMDRSDRDQLTNIKRQYMMDLKRRLADMPSDVDSGRLVVEDVCSEFTAYIIHRFR